MIFELKQKEDKLLKKVYKKSMKELGAFYGFNWTRNVPKIFILKSRKDIDFFLGRKSEGWVVGWTGFGSVFVLDRSKIKTESSHKEGYSRDRYNALIKHELSHAFYKILIKGGYSPIWLWEGLAIHTSGQNKLKKVMPEKFTQLLSFYKSHKNEKGKNVYYESGFFIEMLVKKFGKEKLIKLLKSLQKIKNRKEFDNLFFKTYKFKLSYREINKVYKD
jgi:hypothetical protein